MINLDNRTLEVLEFAKVRQMLAERTATQLGREVAEALLPSTAIEEVTEWQKETGEAKSIMGRSQEVPLGGIKNIRHYLRRAAQGGTLEPGDLLEVGDTLAAGRRVKKFFLESEEPERYPILADLAGRIGVFSSIETSIQECINDFGEVTDGASEELARLRRQIRSANSRIKERLDAFLHSGTYAKMIQEAIVTMRGDRYVIPIKQEYRSHIPGIIHDQSASGATLFIEPLAVVEANNDLRQLLLKEKQEIERILRELTAQVAARAEEIGENLVLLARLDFVVAKARLSYDLRCSEPDLNDRGVLHIVQGRHPLLQGEIVPIDVHLGRKFDTLVITGPNTGGKTVTLKTVGLLTLMAQAGLQVPAKIGTELAVFEHIGCDIGDEQSIEQNLSTFSGHMRNIVRLMGEITDNSLVLLDEVGAGTDPAEGAALAMAILEHLHAAGVKTVATTHYSELKTFAFTRERVENASVEFDVESLRPTYRLLLGLPGHSNAFEIAGRLGLSEPVVRRARQLLTKEDVKVDEMIRSISELESGLQQEKLEAEQLKRQLTVLKEQHMAKLAELGAREKAIISKAQSEARTLLSLTRQEAEEAIRALREVKRESGGAEREKVIRESRERIRQARELMEDTTGEVQEEIPPLRPEEMRKGCRVHIRSLNQNGYILSEANSAGNVEVQAGIIKVTVPAADLQRAPAEAKGPVKTGAGKIMTLKSTSVPSEVDLRGMLVEEVLLKMDKYLDDAFLAGLKQVRIIHGKGTGALRGAVQELLASHYHVTSYRLGENGEGGSGVTVAYLE